MVWWYSTHLDWALISVPSTAKDRGRTSRPCLGSRVEIGLPQFQIPCYRVRPCLKQTKNKAVNIVFPKGKTSDLVKYIFTMTIY